MWYERYLGTRNKYARLGGGGGGGGGGRGRAEMTSLFFLPQSYSLSKTIYGELIVTSSQPTPLNYDMT